MTGPQQIPNAPATEPCGLGRYGVPTGWHRAGGMALVCTMGLLSWSGCQPATEPSAPRSSATSAGESASVTPAPAGQPNPPASAATSDAQPAVAGGHTGTDASAVKGAAEKISGPVTFYQHIAPIVYRQCSQCHRDGDAAPFPLLTYHDVKKHAQQIVDVTSDRIMPPWLPDPQVVQYRGQRVLSDHEIALFRAWAEQGAPEGDAAGAPSPPVFAAGWQLGEPDLVVTMEEPFEVPASGPDIYRNFIIPIPIDRPRWVKGLEFRPGNRRIVHHAFMLLDPTRTIRERDALDPLPGFDGMDTGPAQGPAGEFISWQPGRVPRFVQPGMSWRLNPGTDFILQVHMQPSGKPETLQASIGIYFTDEPPTKYPLKICLESTDIDIPADSADYSFRREFDLPVAVDVLALSPHAHYLGKRMFSWAELPDGKRQWLLKIDDWDLNWQGDYVFDPPVHLPAGTRIVQEFSYDNTSANIHNPFQPPRRVTYGQQATDEMGSLWLQLLPANQDDYKTLYRAMGIKALQAFAERQRKLLVENPRDVKAHIELGKIAMTSGEFAQAQQLFDQAVRLDPSSALAHYHAGNVRLRMGRWEEGVKLLQEALRLQPRMFNAHHDLGMAAMQQKDWAAAAKYFQAALEINPYHTTALRNLAMTQLQQKQIAAARDTLRRAVEADPSDQELAKLLKQVEQSLSAGR